MSDQANTCFRCGRAFRTPQGLGLHHMWLRKAKGGGRIERICPDKRSAEEVRDVQQRIARLRVRLGAHGRHP